MGGAVSGVDQRRRREHRRFDPLRERCCKLDCDHGTRVVPDNCRALDPERVEQTCRDIGPALDRVLLDRGLRGIAEAERVHCDRAKTLAEERENVAVFVARAGRLVEKEDGSAGAGDRTIDLAGRDRHEPALDADHVSSLSGPPVCSMKSSSAAAEGFMNVERLLGSIPVIRCTFTAASAWVTATATMSRTRAPPIVRLRSVARARE